MQKRLERVIGWLYFRAHVCGFGDPGRVPVPISWLHNREDRRCHLVPLSLVRFRLLEIDGELAGYPARRAEIEGKTITVLPSDRFQHDTPIGTYRIRRWDDGRCGWLVYR